MKTTSGEAFNENHSTDSSTLCSTARISILPSTACIIRSRFCAATNSSSTITTFIEMPLCIFIDIPIFYERDLNREYSVGRTDNNLFSEYQSALFVQIRQSQAVTYLLPGFYPQIIFHTHPVIREGFNHDTKRVSPAYDIMFDGVLNKYLQS